MFARAFLRGGRPVFPVLRGMDPAVVAAELARPELVLVSVGEGDLRSVLAGLPEVWRDRVALVQNELLPADWQPHRLIDPTVASIWFEKKKGREVKVVVPTPVSGPGTGLLASTLNTVDIPVEIMHDEAGMLFELVRKNLYILVTNLCGLETGGTVGELWTRHEELAREVAGEVLDVQEALTGVGLDREGLIAAMLVAFDGDPDHLCMGRSAGARLDRALAHGDQYGLELPTLRRIRRVV